MQGSTISGLKCCLACLVAAPFFMAHAGTVVVPGIGGNLQVQVVSYKESRFQTVLKQQYDFSCGSAALASLLTYHYEDPVDEQQVFKAMYEQGDQARIQQQGFSLLDMKNFLSARGYKADGFKMPLDKFKEKAGVPAIVLINTQGYLHFIIIKGISAKQVLLGDPAMGVRSMPRAEFEASWNGMLFVIRSHADNGRATFNREEEWAVNKKAPFGTAFQNQGLADFTLLLPRSQEY
jgi:predicted double-glycine peptidase